MTEESKMPPVTPNTTMAGHGLKLNIPMDISCMRCGGILLENVTWVRDWQFFDDGVAEVHDVIHVCPEGRYDQFPNLDTHPLMGGNPTRRSSEN